MFNTTNMVRLLFMQNYNFVNRSSLLLRVAFVLVTLAGCAKAEPVAVTPQYIVVTATPAATQPVEALQAPQDAPAVEANPDVQRTPEAVARVAPPASQSPFNVRLAWFYKPPKDENDLEMVAERFNFFIMTKGNEPERNQLLSHGAQRPMLQYLRFEAIMDPGDCTDQPWQNNVAYLPGDFCRISQDHPDWFLLDQAGKRIIDSYQDVDFYLMDPGNPEWRAFFLDRIRQAHFDPNWDGVFLDNVEVSLAVREKQKELPAKYPDEASYAKAIQGFLQYLHTNYFAPNHKLLFANLVARQNDENFLQSITYLDGVMHEGWSVDWPKRWRTAEIWDRQLTIAEETQAMGKYIILVGQGKQKDKDVQRFAFASYLLVANGNAAFRYANSDDYNEPWLYEDYNVQLGQPLGPRYQDGNAWRRDFTNGYVWVDPHKHKAKIELAEESTWFKPLRSDWVSFLK